MSPFRLASASEAEGHGCPNEAGSAVGAGANPVRRHQRGPACNPVPLASAGVVGPVMARSLAVPVDLSTTPEPGPLATSENGPPGAGC